MGMIRQFFEHPLENRMEKYFFKNRLQLKYKLDFAKK
jgi:hypothetical protein